MSTIVRFMPQIEKSRCTLTTIVACAWERFELWFRYLALPPQGEASEAASDEATGKVGIAGFVCSSVEDAATSGPPIRDSAALRLCRDCARRSAEVQIMAIRSNLDNGYGNGCRANMATKHEKRSVEGMQLRSDYMYIGRVLASFSWY